MSATRLFIVLGIYNFVFRKRLASFGPRPVQSKRLKVKKESRLMRGATFQSPLLCPQKFCKESLCDLMPFTDGIPVVKSSRLYQLGKHVLKKTYRISTYLDQILSSVKSYIILALHCLE